MPGRALDDQVTAGVCNGREIDWRKGKLGGNLHKEGGGGGSAGFCRHVHQSLDDGGS